MVNMKKRTECKELEIEFKDPDKRSGSSNSNITHVGIGVSIPKPTYEDTTKKASNSILKKDVRERVKSLLPEGKTLRQFLIDNGIADWLIYAHTSQNKSISMNTLIRLCNALNVTPNDLLGYEKEERMLKSIKVCLDDGAYEPTRAYKWDAGIDLKTPIDFTVDAKNSFVVDTGVHVEIPKGYVGMVKSKSGLNINHRITTTGVIDAGFTGTIKVRMQNNSMQAYEFHAGDKITQLVIMPVETPTITVVESIEGGERGDNGYGSSGK